MKFKSNLSVVLGFLLLIIAGLGVFLPILPTTPFVILAAGCFSGNPRLRVWLEKSKLFGGYIRNYRERTGLSKKTVAVSLFFLWAMLSYSMYRMQAVWAYIVMPCIGFGVSIHILYMARPRNGKGTKAPDVDSQANIGQDTSS